METIWAMTYYGQLCVCVVCGCVFVGLGGFAESKIHGREKPIKS